MLNKYILIVDVCDYNIMYTVETDDIITFILNKFSHNGKFNYIIYKSEIHDYSDEVYEELYKKCKIHWDICE